MWVLRVILWGFVKFEKVLKYIDDKASGMFNKVLAKHINFLYLKSYPLVLVFSTFNFKSQAILKLLN